MKYSLDTSAFLDGWSRWYPIQTFPDIWVNLGLMIDSGEIVTIPMVIDELKAGSSGPIKWLGGRVKTIVMPLDQAIQEESRVILKKFPNLVNNTTGKSQADPFVIALAKVRDLTVLTGEKHSRTPGVVRIPDVCDHFKIPFINIMGLIKRQGWKFVNAPTMPPPTAAPVASQP
jgi:hypothetical protein